MVIIEEKSTHLGDRPMIRVESLSEVIRIAYQSVYVKGECPLSLLFIAETDHGKSHLILSYIPEVEHMNIEKLTDASAMGIYKAVRDKTGPVTLVIPDFHSIVSHKASVTEGTINALMSLLQDGVMKIGVGPGEAIELKGKRANLITAMTPGILAGKAGKWRKLGFLRRMLPVCYSYSEDTALLIHNSIRTGEYHHELKTFRLTVTTPQVVIIKSPIDSDIQKLSILVSQYLGNRGFTVHKFFRVYCQARALLFGRNIVNEEDMNSLTEFARFCNPDSPQEV
jgi:hypothetical protein